MSIKINGPSLRIGSQTRGTYNLLTNSQLAGAATGTPGTAPTGWSPIVVNGTVVSVAADGLNGGNSVRVSTTAARHFYSQSIAVLANTVYTFSALVDVTTATQIQEILFATSLPAGATLQMRLDGSNVAQTTSSGTGLHTIEFILTVAGTAGTPSWRLGIGVTGAATPTADVRFWAPQLRAGTGRA